MLAFQNACCRGDYFRFFFYRDGSLMVSNVMSVSTLSIGLELLEVQYIGGAVLVHEQALRLYPTVQTWLKSGPDPRLN